MEETTKTQYQHYVPQFLLRNYSHSYRPQDRNRNASKRSKRKYEKGMYPGDPVVNNLNLSADPPIICEAPVTRILGQMDMYRDMSKPSAAQQHVEQMFSELESRAGAVFRKITKSFEKVDKGLWFTRDERDLIRKFLFLLKYRGLGFHRRFYHDNAESYDENDRELLQDYMAEKGFKRPMDVWFDNLKTIMELRMDPEQQWISDLPKRMFPDDALWFITHAQCSYMAICTPSDPSDEFILTDNSYNIFEGPNRFAADADTGKVQGTAHTPLHEFAPISPRLMIVLRSFMFPVPEEDTDASVKEDRDFFRSMSLDMVYNGEVKSLLSDLPIEKARNNYTEIVNGRIQLIRGEGGEKRKGHKFCFKFFPIEQKHVDTINAILLDNAYVCSRVVFKSIESFSRTLDWYLTAPCTIGKVVIDEDKDLRLTYLKNMATISRALGSKKEAVWMEVPVPVIPGYEKFRLSQIEKRRLSNKMIKNELEPLPDTEHMKVYKALGGSVVSIFRDTEQAGLMWNLRVKIDVWSQGLNEALRQRNRDLLIEAYLRLPPSRAWSYLKRVRVAFEGKAAELEGVNNPYDGTNLTCHIIKLNKLTQLMYKATMTDLKMQKWSKSNPSVASRLGKVKYIMALQQLALIEPQSIRDCGIEEIEQLAAYMLSENRNHSLQNPPKRRDPLRDDNDVNEFVTRSVVRSSFMEILDGKLDPSLLKRLKGAFFETLYWTHPLGSEMENSAR